MKLQIAYSKRDEVSAKKIIQTLSFNHDLKEVNSYLLDSNAVTIIVFTSSTSEKELLEELPWLKEELTRSSVKHLKLMPLYAYHSKMENPEQEFEKEVGTLYEDIFSTEFKPFGWDFDSNNPEKEFPSVLEQYSE